MTSPEDTLDARSELLAVLNRVYSDTWYIYMLHPNYGICKILEDELSDAALDLWQARKTGLFRTWRHYSWSPTFPVPAPKGESPVDYYCNAADLWTGRQRMLRRDLLRHIMAEL